MNTLAERLDRSIDVAAACFLLLPRGKFLFRQLGAFRLGGNRFGIGSLGGIKGRDQAACEIGKRPNLREDDHRVNKNAGKLGAVGKHPIRINEVQDQVMQRDHGTGQHDRDPAAPHRDDRETGKERHMHVDLQVVARELEHQQRNDAGDRARRDVAGEWTRWIVPPAGGGNYHQDRTDTEDQRPRSATHEGDGGDKRHHAPKQSDQHLAEAGAQLMKSAAHSSVLLAEKDGSPAIARHADNAPASTTAVAPDR